MLLVVIVPLTRVHKCSLSKLPFVILGCLNYGNIAWCAGTIRSSAEVRHIWRGLHSLLLSNSRNSQQNHRDYSLHT